MSENVKTAPIAIMGVAGIPLVPVACAAVTRVSNDQAMCLPLMLQDLSLAIILVTGMRALARLDWGSVFHQ